MAVDQQLGPFVMIHNRKGFTNCQPVFRGYSALPSILSTDWRFRTHSRQVSP